MPKSYRLSSLKDVYEKLPADKIEACMREIASGMVQAKLLAGVMSAAADSLVPGSSAEAFWPDVCNWIDDGLMETTINVSVDGGDAGFTYRSAKA